MRASGVGCCILALQLIWSPEAIPAMAIPCADAWIVPRTTAQNRTRACDRISDDKICPQQ